MAMLDSPRIVTSREGFDDSYTMSRYLATGGYEGLKKALTMFPEAVAKEVDDASLLGRGGAGFPAGRKWSMLRKSPVSYLVVNGDESEPATFKDHFLVERDPHQLIEGVIIASYALQVSQAFIFLRGEFALGLERVQQAVNDAYEHGALGSKIFGSDFSLDIVIHPGAGAYICGEETALIEALEGKRGFPRIKPPFFPAVTGLYGEPTVVNNVETMANLPWIVLNGGSGFRRSRWWTFRRHETLRFGRTRKQPRRLRNRDGEEHLPRFDLRPQPRWRNPQRQEDQGLHSWRRVGPLVWSRSSRPAAWSRRSRRKGIDARFRFSGCHGRNELRRACGVAHHEVLLERVLWPVHAVPGRFGLDRARDVPPRARWRSHGRPRVVARPL